MTRAERIREIERISSMVDDVESELQKIPGVSHVTIGLKVVNLSPTEEICFRVYVAHKKPATEIPDAEKIPTQIGNIKTDVNEIPTKITAAAAYMYDEAKYRPLSGGTKILSSKAEASGTLGCFVYDNENANIALLTNCHTLMAYGEEPGHPVGQPDFCCDDCCCRCGEIAQLTRGVWDEKNVDCAIATLTGDHQDNWTNYVLDLGPVTSLPVDENGAPKDPPVAGDTVFKRGKSSGPTEGVILEITHADHPIEVGYTTKDGHVKKYFTQQIAIVPKNPSKPFSSKGDSGSVIVNHLNQVIGLLFGDDEQTDNSGNVLHAATKTLANPIGNVLTALNISIPDTGTLLTLPLLQSEKTRTPRRPDIVAELEREIQKHPDGAVLIDMFKEHRKELMNLINNDREVKVSWHRMQGPSFVAHLMEKIKKPSHTVPISINGVSYQRMLTKMSVVLEKKGSRRMASAIEKHSTKALLLVAGLIQSFSVTDQN